MFQSLQCESEKAQEQQSQLQGKLMELDGCRGKAEEKVRELTLENGRLKMDMAILKQRGGSGGCVRDVIIAQLTWRR